MLNVRWAKDIIRVIPKSDIEKGYLNVTKEAYKPFEDDEWMNIGFPKRIGDSWDFRETDISDGDYWDAELEGMDFSGSKCVNTYFGCAKLKGAIFRDANLEGARFPDADLENVDFTGANLKGAKGLKKEVEK